MTYSPPFPEATRTAETREHYRALARRLLRQFERESGVEWRSDPLAACRWLANRRPTLARATWRSYKAAMIFYLSEGRGPIEAVEYLLPQTSEPCLRRTSRTSATKLKRLPDEELTKILDHLAKTRGKWDLALGLWLTLGRLTGLRPIEWRVAAIEGEWLVVINAKTTNGRSFGPIRRLRIDPLNEAELGALERFLALVRAHEWNALYRGCRDRLYTVCRTLWPRRRRHPTLYSARHQFSADAKSAGWNRVEVAAGMGHASDRTAGEHYGRKAAGRGEVKMTPDPIHLTEVTTEVPSVISLDWKGRS